MSRHVSEEAAALSYNKEWGEKSEALNAVPHYMRPAFYRWVMWGIWGGDFLDAVVTNDLMGAMRKADDENRAAIFDWMRLFYNGAPAGCFGSDRIAERWAQRGGILGRCSDCNGAFDVPGIEDSKRVITEQETICEACAHKRADEKRAAQIVGG